MSDALIAPQELPVNGSLFSSNGRYQLILQNDGNLVIYDLQVNHHPAKWASGTNGKAVSKAIMQDDGNFVIYGFPNAVWATGTFNQPGAWIILTDEGNLMVIRQIRNAIWSSGTAGQ
jgi:hypothetical protein